MHRRIMIILAITLLSACEHNNAIQTRLAIRSANYLNPDINGTASPVVVDVFELTRATEFNEASYSKLSGSSAIALGNTLIDRHTIEVRPGHDQVIRQYVSPSTRAIGIIAAYRNLDNADWKKVIYIPSETSAVRIGLSLASQNITVTRED